VDGDQDQAPGGDEVEILGRRERKKRETRRALEEAAWNLFQLKGFGATTVEDIAEAADVAPRTFFRYFDSKEAALFGDWRSYLDDLQMRVAQRPAEEPPLVAIERAFAPICDMFTGDRDLLLARKRVIESAPHVGTYQHDVIEPAWQGALTEALADRLDVDPDHDMRPSLFASVAVATVAAAGHHWIVQGGQIPLADVLRQAFAELHAGTNALADASPDQSAGGVP
jgi:AcrR family transcriptional regulator